MTHHVEIVTAPAITVAVTRFHVRSAELPSIAARIGQAFATVAAALGRTDVAPNGPAIAAYAPEADGFEVAAGFRVPPTFTAPPGLVRLDLGHVEAAHTTHIGAYSELSSAYTDLQVQASAAGRTLDPTAPMWEEYWSEPGTPDDETRTEIYWPLTPAG